MRRFSITDSVAPAATTVIVLKCLVCVCTGATIRAEQIDKPSPAADLQEGDTLKEKLDDQLTMNHNLYEMANYQEITQPLSKLIPDMLSPHKSYVTLSKRLLRFFSGLTKVSKTIRSEQPMPNSELFSNKDIRRRVVKRSPGCLARCIWQGALHPVMCHSLC